MCRLLHIIGGMIDLRQAILDQLQESGLKINQLAKQVEGKVARRTVYAYLRGEEDSLSKNVSILLDAVGLTITTTKKAKRPGKENDLTDGERESMADLERVGVPAIVATSVRDVLERW